ncbi:J domain-containing protein [Sphingomonas sediminicola]|uniref:J domain-containing protein n=1 Tax=Sphingomonas sediminicola TaxID=386874 RepID=UPI001FE2913B|nr:J domain-containing protein [Sphingomonas sediminicola]
MPPKKNRALQPSAHLLNGNGWSGDGSRSRDEMRALEVLELDPDVEFKDVKVAYRRLAKEHHPDTNAGNRKAADKFQKVQAAYEVLRKAEERKNGKVA